MLPDFTLFLKQVHMDEIHELLSMQLLSVHYLNAKIKKGDFFFLLGCSRSHITGKGSPALPGTDLGQCQALSPHPSPLRLPQQRRCPRAVGSNSSEAGNKREMCGGLVDRRWHRAFIFTRARVDSCSVGAGKVSYVSYDGNKQPQQQARVRSPPAAGPAVPLEPSTGCPRASPTSAWGSLSFPCLPTARR